MQPHHKWLGKLSCFLQAVILVCFNGTAPAKGSSIAALPKADLWFTTEPPSSKHPWFFLFSPLQPCFLLFRCWCWFSFDFFLCEFHLILGTADSKQPTSFATHHICVPLWSSWMILFIVHCFLPLCFPSISQVQHLVKVCKSDSIFLSWAWIDTIFVPLHDLGKSILLVVLHLTFLNYFLHLQLHSMFYCTNDLFICSDLKKLDEHPLSVLISLFFQGL